MRLILPAFPNHIVQALHVLIHFLRGSGLFVRRDGDLSPFRELSNWLSEISTT